MTTEALYDGTSLEQCSDMHCIMLMPCEKRGRVGTNGGCMHLKQRGPEATQLIRKLAAEIVRLRLQVEAKGQATCKCGACA